MVNSSIDRIRNIANDYTIATNSSLKIIPDQSRTIFFWLILTVSVIAIIGNLMAIMSMIAKKCKFLQKTCIVTLAIADILTVVVFSVNHLVVLSHELMIWRLGSFLCGFIPMMQVLATTASSIALLIIALDRYQNVVYALSKRYDPKPIVCVVAAVVIFMISGALSYPMFTYFNYQPIKILYVGPYSQKPVLEPAHMCYANKDKLAIYYVVVVVAIFLPILCVFIWFYYNIAVLIWKHRKPLYLRYQKDADTDDTSSSATKTTNLTITGNSKLNVILKKSKNQQVKKKIRTFRIVVVLMVSFAVCRLPYWTFYVMRILASFTGDTIWNIVYAFITILLFNCAMNPLLYTFLNQTVRVIKVINDFVCKIFCCCFSNAEFEDFEKENPFVPKHLHQNIHKEPKPNQKEAVIRTEALRLIPGSTRQPFFYISLVLSVVAVFANLLAIKSIIMWELKHLQKLSIISLSLTDIFSVAIFSTNAWESLSKEPKTKVFYGCTK